MNIPPNVDTLAYYSPQWVKSGKNGTSIGLSAIKVCLYLGGYICQDVLGNQADAARSCPHTV